MDGILPYVSLSQFSPKTHLEVSYTILLRPFLWIDSHPGEVKPLDTHCAKVTNRLPMKQVHCTHYWRGLRATIPAVGTMLTKGSYHAALYNAIVISNEYLHVLAKT